MVDTARKKLSLELAKALNDDFGRFADEFECKRAKAKIEDHAPGEQSRLITEAELPTPSCELGMALLEELRQPFISDIVLKVEDERFLCHRTVLMSRCGYFSAMMKNDWSESNADEITLNDIKPNAAAAVLCFLYGASPDFPSFCSLVDVLQVSDMLGITGLAVVAQFFIRFAICHNFHKPCNDCISNMSEIINLATVYTLTDLHKMCLKWNSRHFTKMWPTKTFASLHPKHQAKCMKAVVDSMTVGNIVHFLMEADKLLSGITRVQWTKPVIAIATELLTVCCDYVAQHFLDVTANRTILVLFQGMGWKTDIIERILVQIASELTVENVCDVHIATSRLVLMAEKEGWNQEFLDLLFDLKAKVWAYLVSSYYAVIHTESWHHVSSGDKMKLKSETICQGDSTRRLSKKPVLSSSLRKKLENHSKAAPATQRKEAKRLRTRNSGPKEECNSQPIEPGPPPERQRIVAIQEMRWGESFTDIFINPSSAVTL